MQAAVPAGVGAGDGDVIGTSDPTSNDYDPTTLIEAMGKTPSEVFEREPRNSEFALRREESLRERLAARLHQRRMLDVDVEVECRTSSCDVRLAVEDGTNRTWNALVEALDLQFLAEYSQMGPMMDRGGVFQIVFVFGAELRSHDEYDQWLRRHEEMDGVPAATP